MGPTILSGLPPNHILSIPSCFPADLMHLVSLSIPDLLMNLWRGTVQCGPGDNVNTWDWAVLRNIDTWEVHGKNVEETLPYLPGSFNWPPRNPADKISSGYKAWEYLTWIFGMGPSLLKEILPEKYYANFCELVRGIRILHQYSISKKELQSAYIRLARFSVDFENLYCQRRIDRLHFVRHAIHQVGHLAREVIRIGPPGYTTQWPMERTIGDLTSQIRQPSKPYANLSQRGLRAAQVNALTAMLPEPDTKAQPSLPRGSIDQGSGYVLLRARDNTSRFVCPGEASAIRSFLLSMGEADTEKTRNWKPSVMRWARLRLPNGQVARSLWKEQTKHITKLRTSRNVKVSNIVSGFH